MVLLIALVAIAVATNPENRVLGLVSYAWAGFVPLSAPWCCCSPCSGPA